ncbi:MAG TPA: tRNA (adenosine(37)-N6)-threonylcarbamoyltransferase complex dimerization subunit type 1 TsaB [Bryobacteraceae bacterium]|nr:tRNA (adenosine(37)-N6)-threonylcarbamoyltransferase complex dimerization subunit type 1 TsaB [Bryobacteraceae bacterium]
MNQFILSLDTTHEFGSIALLDGTQVLEEVLLHSPDGFGHVLFEHLARLLGRHGRRVDQIACFAAAAGPGSFTGVRVGLACVKGLAEAVGRKVVAVSNLEALARFGSAEKRAVVLDARRGEIYGAVYGAEGEVLGEPVVTRFPAWLETLPAGEIEFLSTDFAPFRAALENTRFANSKITAAPRALAAIIGRIAHERFLAGLARDPAEIDADYVRRSDAELLWKDR